MGPKFSEIKIQTRRSRDVFYVNGEGLNGLWQTCMVSACFWDRHQLYGLPDWPWGQASEQHGIHGSVSGQHLLQRRHGSVFQSMAAGTPSG
jgi:hypothetical protein